MNKLRVLELFGGIGACSKALEKLGIDYEIADYVEIDKYAVKSFNAIHNTNFESQDITQWDKQIDVDLIMHGSPCQDFSLAGLQAGGDEGSGTRSSLMYETIRIVEKLKPKYVVWENVKNVISKKHKHNFDNYINRMSELGYTNYYQVLNAKDYGIPQNRERVFTISILGNNNYEFPNGEKCNNKINRIGGLYNQTTRWGIYDKNGLAPTITASMGMGGGHVPMIEDFEFPPKQELKLKLKDMLEDNVDEKYYLSDKMTSFFIYNEEKQKERGNGFRFNVTDGNVVAKTITTRAGSRMDDNFINEAKRLGGIFDKENQNHQAGSIYDTNGLSPTLDTMQGGWRQPCVSIDSTKKLRIRKLTPKECWRLMGFDDEDFDKASKVNSNSQLYKQAGNSIVVNVLMAIFNELLKKEGE